MTPVSAKTLVAWCNVLCLLLFLSCCGATDSSVEINESAQLSFATSFQHSSTSFDSGSDVLSSGEPNTRTILKNATILDVQTTLEKGSIVLEGDKIVAVMADISPADMAGATIYDLAGQFVIPGLIDGHVHLAHSSAGIYIGDTLVENLRALLYSGITTVIDAGSPEIFYDLRDLVRSGNILAPRIFAAGRMITVEKSHPCEIYYDRELCSFVETPEEASRIAQESIERGADFLKLVIVDGGFSGAPETPSLSLDEARQIVVAAQNVNIPVMAHVDENSDALTALQAGVSLLGHPVFAESMSEALINEIVARHVFVDSTITAFEGIFLILNGKLDLNSPLTEATVPGAVLSNYRYLYEHPEALDQDWLKASEIWTSFALANLTALWQKGARIIAGSDSGYYFAPHGLSLYNELAHLQQIGLSFKEILETVTTNPAAFLGVEAELGTIEPGKYADLLVLQSDPRQDIRHVADIAMIFHSGNRLDREALALTHGEYGLVTTPERRGDGDVCLTSDDCRYNFACDQFLHVCAKACSPPMAALGECDPSTYCGTAEALPLTDEDSGVCRPGYSCDLYKQDCYPAAYGLNCVPMDADTNYCYSSGPRGAGESCNWYDPAAYCQQGYLCSSYSQTCLKFCDPYLGSKNNPMCPLDFLCYAEFADKWYADKWYQVWFGVCLAPDQLTTAGY